LPQQEDASHARFAVNPSRLADETLPPNPPFNRFPRFVPSVGFGGYRLKIEKMGHGALRWLRSKFVQRSG
ncbi:MAG: hypothetical protein PHV02_13680, partial [Rhodocyclaceae bacterium]|nr:hypothetical protein [Rhodocyclaceae bacterium]